MELTDRIMFRRSLSEGDSSEVRGIKEEGKLRESVSLCDFEKHDMLSPLLTDEDENFRKEFFIRKNTKSLKTAKRQINDILISDAPVLDREELIDEKEDLFCDDFKTKENRVKEDQLDYNGLVDNKHPGGDSGYTSTDPNRLSESDFSLISSEKESGVKGDDMHTGFGKLARERINFTRPQQVGEAKEKVAIKMIRQHIRTQKRKMCIRSKKARLKKKHRPAKIEMSVISPEYEKRCGKMIQQIINAVQRVNLLRSEKIKITYQFKWNLSSWKFNHVASTGIACQNNIWFNRFFYVFPIWELLTLDFKKEWDRLCSFGTTFTHLHLHNVSYIRLAETGFYFKPDEGKEPCVKCFACSITWPLSTLEAAPNCNEKVKVFLHEKGCNLSGSGNVPIHPAPHRSFSLPDTLPSKNKIPFRNEIGLQMKCVDFCGLNTFYTDQMTMLKTYPRLKEKYENFMQINNPFKAILHMFEESVQYKNSAKGMVGLLMYVNQTNLENETKICLSNFELISFICQLMKKKIELEAKCNCGTKVNSKEQIIVSPCKRSRCGCNKRMPGYFQHCIDQTLQYITLPQTCPVCLCRFQWELLGPPPSLFISLTFLDVEDITEIPQVIHILGRKYQRWGVYLHGGHHFTCQLPNPDGGTYIYDDHNVVPDDPFSSYLISLEDCLCRSGKPCMVSFCTMED